MLLVWNPAGSVVGGRLVPYTAPGGSLYSTDAGASASEVDVRVKAPRHPPIAYRRRRALLPQV